MRESALVLTNVASQSNILVSRLVVSFFNAFRMVALVMLISPVAVAEPHDTFDHDHSLFSEVLSEYVSNGLVNYKALKANQATLNRYLRELEDIDPEAYEKWTRQQKLALWINAYNAYTIKAVINHYPIEPSFLADALGQYPQNSIRQISGVWDKMTWQVMDKAFTLNFMEHAILLKELAEPRVHFVLVCASVGCPYLESKAFDADNINERLDQAGINYIYGSRRVQIDKKNKVVRLSQIFEWFKEDFKPIEAYAGIFSQYPAGDAALLSWVYRFANDADRRFLEKESLKISYLYYDWALNEGP